MTADLAQDLNAAAKAAQTALVKTVRSDHRRAKSLVAKTVRAARKTNEKAAHRARQMLATVGAQAEHRYLDLRDVVQARPLTALSLGAGLALGLGLLLWGGFQIERKASASQRAQVFA